jgi:hypothetical protein
MFFWEIPPVSDTKTTALPALQGHSRDDFLFTKSPALQQHPSAVTEKNGVEDNRTEKTISAFTYSKFSQLWTILHL